MRFDEVPSSRPDAAAVASAHLAAGGLLAHPTSGVYGIGGRPGGGMVAAVSRLKGRPEGPGLVYLAAAMSALRESFPRASWPPLAVRLAETLWPGPLTLVLADGSEHGVALRVEPHEATRAVLARAGGVLGSTSLNRSGGDPASDPEEVRRVLGDFPASDRGVLFLEAGPLPGPPPSTLVRVPGSRGDPFDILRPGAIEVEQVAAVAGAG